MNIFSYPDSRLSLVLPSRAPSFVLPSPPRIAMATYFLDRVMELEHGVGQRVDGCGCGFLGCGDVAGG